MTRHEGYWKAVHQMEADLVERHTKGEMNAESVYLATRNHALYLIGGEIAQLNDNLLALRNDTRFHHAD